MTETQASQQMPHATFEQLDREHQLLEHAPLSIAQSMQHVLEQHLSSQPEGTLESHLHPDEVRALLRGAGRHFLIHAGAVPMPGGKFKLKLGTQISVALVSSMRAYAPGEDTLTIVSRGSHLSAFLCGPDDFMQQIPVMGKSSDISTDNSTGTVKEPGREAGREADREANREPSTTEAIQAATRTPIHLAAQGEGRLQDQHIADQASYLEEIEHQKYASEIAGKPGFKAYFHRRAMQDPALKSLHQELMNIIQQSADEAGLQLYAMWTRYYLAIIASHKNGELRYLCRLITRKHSQASEIALVIHEGNPGLIPQLKWIRGLAPTGNPALYNKSGNYCLTGISVSNVSNSSVKQKLQLVRNVMQITCQSFETLHREYKNIKLPEAYSQNLGTQAQTVQTPSKEKASTQKGQSSKTAEAASSRIIAAREAIRSMVLPDLSRYSLTEQTMCMKECDMEHATSQSRQSFMHGEDCEYTSDPQQLAQTCTRVLEVIDQNNHSGGELRSEWYSNYLGVMFRSGGSDTGMLCRVITVNNVKPQIMVMFENAPLQEAARRLGVDIQQAPWIHNMDCSTRMRSTRTAYTTMIIACEKQTVDEELELLGRIISVTSTLGHMYVPVNKQSRPSVVSEQDPSIVGMIQDWKSRNVLSSHNLTSAMRPSNCKANESGAKVLPGQGKVMDEFESAGFLMREVSRIPLT